MILKPEKRWAACGETFTTYDEALARIRQVKREGENSIFRHLIEEWMQGYPKDWPTSKLAEELTKDLLLNFIIKPKPKK